MKCARGNYSPKNIARVYLRLDIRSTLNRMILIIGAGVAGLAAVQSVSELACISVITLHAERSERMQSESERARGRGTWEKVSDDVIAPELNRMTHVHDTITQ